MLRLSELDVKVGNVDVDLLDLKEVLAVRLLSCGQLDLEAEAISTKEDVGNASVSDAWEALLSLDIV
jgi:hypothetical protein